MKKQTLPAKHATAIKTAKTRLHAARKSGDSKNISAASAEHEKAVDDMLQELFAQGEEDGVGADAPETSDQPVGV